MLEEVPYEGMYTTKASKLARMLARAALLSASLSSVSLSLVSSARAHCVSFLPFPPSPRRSFCPGPDRKFRDLIHTVTANQHPPAPIRISEQHLDDPDPSPERKSRSGKTPHLFPRSATSACFLLAKNRNYKLKVLKLSAFKAFQQP